MKPIYYYNGQEAVLAYKDEVVGIEPIVVEQGIGVYPADGFPLGEVTPCLTLDDCYSCYSEAEEIVFGETINPENEDGIVLGWLRKSEYLRQRALIEIKNKPNSWLEELMIDERVCVYPNGDVAKLEYVTSTDTAGVECVYEVGGNICCADNIKQQIMDAINEIDADFFED